MAGLVSSIVVVAIVALRTKVRFITHPGGVITHLAEPICVSKTTASRSIGEPEPVLVNTAVWGPLVRPDRPPSNCWNDAF